MTKTKTLVALCLVWSLARPQMAIKDQGITIAPNPSAILQVDAEKKGVLIPRMTLTGHNAFPDGTIPDVDGLMIYNEGKINEGTPQEFGYKEGYYYWEHGAWQSIVDVEPTTIVDQTEDAVVMTSTVMSALRPYEDSADTVRRSLDGYSAEVTSPNGLFSVRVFLLYKPGSRVKNSNIQIRYNGKIPAGGNLTLMWNAKTWHTSSANMASNTLVIEPENVNYWHGNSGDYTTVLKPNPTTDVFWGKQYIYSSGLPEQRDYIFTSQDPNDKTVYRLKFTMWASNPELILPSGFPLIRQTKIFLMLREITAE